jgi:1-deoxy-D-xylulose-5-phosphate synthase
VLFEDLGMKYVGPIDGHDIAAMEAALRRAKAFGGPVIVHAVTVKGYGYQPAVDDEADCLHSVGVIDPVTGKPINVSARAGPASSPTRWSRSAPSARRRRHHRRDAAAGRAARVLQRLPRAHLRRRHRRAARRDLRAGLAMGGMHPVVCLYATFLNRRLRPGADGRRAARQPVTFVLDRAGVTGEDGASHNGMWDLSLLQLVPGLRIAAPRDAATLREELREALAVDDGPTAVRFPKGAVPDDIPAQERLHGLDLLRRAPGDDVLLVAVGSMAPLGLEVADRAAAQGVGVTVVDPRWVSPVSPALVELARGYRLVLTVEDSGRTGGIGSMVSQALRDAEVDVPTRDLGIPQRFLDHASRAQLLAEIGLTAQDVARRVVETMARLDGTGLRAEDEPRTVDGPS